MAGLPWKYLLAAALIVAGVLLAGCGATVCWRRWKCWRCKSVEDIRREEGKPDS
jgi:hypothetical protein